MLPRFIIFFLMVSTFVVGTHAYLAWRLGRGLSRGRRRLVQGLAALSAVTLPLLLALGRTGSGLEPLAHLAYVHMGLWSMLLATVAAFDLTLLAGRVVDGVAVRFTGQRPSHQLLPDSPQRREALLGAARAGLLGLAGVQSGAALAGNARGFRVVEVEVPVPGLDPALHGLKIVQLTDVHVGPTIGNSFVQEMVDAANALEPDLVALTGDLVDGSVARLAPHVAPLAGLRSRHGTFFCTGNHEYYSGVHEWVEHLRGLGLAVLLNEHRVLEHGGAPLVVAGVTDITAGDMEPTHATDVAGALAGAPEGPFRLLLAHQPRSIYAAAEHAVDLQLTGHTHGGQYFPGTVLIHLAHPYVRGLHKHADRTWIYVSEGTGWWGPPFRLGSRAEITLLRLVAAA